MPVVTSTITDGIAFIKLDDGKKNAVSPTLIRELHQALDEAEASNATVVITGQPGILSAGFDLNIMRKGNLESLDLVNEGFALTERLLSYPMPVIMACAGHAVAMGAFLLLAADYRIGIKGDFKIALNEVRIGMTVPYAGLTLCKHRLTAKGTTRTAILGQTLSPDKAAALGFFDELVTAETLEETTRSVAQDLATVDPEAHRNTKLRVRRELLIAMKVARQLDRADFVGKGLIREARKRIG